MELHATISCTVRGSAQITEQGDLSLKVFAQAEYAPGRTTTAEVQMHELSAETQAAVQGALAAAVAEALELLGSRIQKAMHKSHDVSVALREI